MEIKGNFDTKTNQWVLAPKQLNRVLVGNSYNAYVIKGRWSKAKILIYSSPLENFI